MDDPNNVNLTRVVFPLPALTKKKDGMNICKALCSRALVYRDIVAIILAEARNSRRER